MNNEIKPGDRVEVTRTRQGGFFKGRYLATVIGQSSRNRVKVKDDAGNEHGPYFTHVKKLP